MRTRYLVLSLIVACSDPPGTGEPGVPIFTLFALEGAELQVRS